MSDFPEHVMLVRVSVDPTVEDDWNRWYDEKHLPEILACPGIEFADRYVTEADGAREYITLYKLSSPDAMKGEEFNARRGWEEFAPYVTAKVRQFTKV